MTRTLYLYFALAYAGMLAAAVLLLWIMETVSGVSPGPAVAPAAFVAAILISGTRYAKLTDRAPSAAGIWGLSLGVTALAFSISAGVLAIFWVVSPDWMAAVSGEFAKVDANVLLLLAAAILAVYIVSARLFLGFALSGIGQA